MSDIKSPKQVRDVRITVENSVKLDPKQPVPIYGGDYYYVVSGKKYIPFIGRKDNFANVLLEARLSSTTHNACITSIAQSAIGKGLIVLEQESPDKEFITWTGNVNACEKTLNEVLKKIADGERANGNVFIEVIRGEISGKKFLKLKLHNLIHCRLSEPNDEDIPASVYVSKLFAKKNYNEKEALRKAREIPLWNDNLIDKNKVWVKNENGTFSTMLHFKNEVNGIEYYGLPASIASLRDQFLEGRYSQFDIDCLDNNMVLGGMLIFKSSMTKEEAQGNAKEILLSHVGDGKTGRIAVISSESGVEDVEFKEYQSQRDGSFLESNKKVSGTIIKSHGWDSILAGTDDTGALGKGSGFIRSIWDAKEAMLLNPLRDRIIENVVSPIVKIYSDWFSKPNVAKYRFGFKSAMPFSFMGDIKPETFMKVKEARALAGLDPDDSVGEKYLSEMTSNKSNVQNSPTSKEGIDND